MTQNIRPYQDDTDREATYRIWQECGWIGTSDAQKKFMDTFMDGTTRWVGEIRGEVESMVATDRGSLRYLEQDIPYGLIAAVNTSHIARRQGLAGRICVRAIADLAAKGAAVAGLGMFEQGYYDRLGFGTGSYDHRIKVAPNKLKVPHATRPPHRLTRDDWEQIATCRINRRKVHGNVTIDRPEFTKQELYHSDNGFGFGFYDNPDGSLSHYVWLGAKNLERGPYNVYWMAYQKPSQLRELLGVLKNLGDQVYLISCWELDDVQLQTFVDAPFQAMHQTAKSPYEQRVSSFAWWQARILDLPACVNAWAQAVRRPVQFNLTLEDPITRLLPEDTPWQGLSGEYTVQLSPVSGEVQHGHTEGLPVMEVSVNALTRLWLGVSSAWALHVDESLQAPEELIMELDTAILLPTPKVGWIL